MLNWHLYTQVQTEYLESALRATLWPLYAKQRETELRVKTPFHTETNNRKLKRGSTASHHSRLSQLQLPLEITELVFANCDLETCVVFREVNSCLYNAFKALQATIIRQKVSSRDEWLQPRRTCPEIETWGQCALILETRLMTKNRWVTESEERQKDIT